MFSLLVEEKELTHHEKIEWKHGCISEIFGLPKKFEFCREARGKAGKWMYNNKSALWWQGQPSNITSNLTSTQWVWQDDEEENCPFTLFNLENLCHSLNSLNIKRLFFVGDSTTHMMYTELRLLLNFHETSQFHPQSFTMKCTNDSIGFSDKNESSFLFEVVFSRNDHLDRNLDPNKFRRPNGPLCGHKTYCWPWLDLYNKSGLSDHEISSYKTLLIVNIGVHYHDIYQYKNAADDFFDNTVPNYMQQNDIVLFRLSVPGHKDCTGQKVPFFNYSQYQGTKTTMYEWNLVEEFNDYIRSKVAAANAPNNTATNISIGLLDVFNMTILRRDGHSDCLHYQMPGPSRWWVHLFASYLKDLENFEEEKKYSISC